MAEQKKSPELLQQEQMVKEGKEAPQTKLRDDVAAVYEVGEGHVRVFLDTLTGKTVDLNKITLKEAADLAERGILKKK